MNILFLSRDYPPNLIGGVGVYVQEASQALSRMGHNVFVITGGEDRENEYVCQGVKVYTVKISRLKIFNPVRDRLKGFIERLEYSLAVSRKLKEIARQKRIDIVESCEARAEGFWYFLFNRKPKLIIKLHTPESIVFKLDHVKKNLDYQLIEYLEQWWIERADQVISLTDAIGRLTCQYFKIKKCSFPKVCNPIDINRLTHTDCKENTSGKDVLYIGRLEFRKGVNILLRTIPRVIDRHPEARFIFIGSDCGMRDYILSKAERLRIQDKIILVGEIARDKVIDYYYTASCCVVPSLWENHPYVCLEAMACGRPVIASNVGGIPEIIKHGSTGLLFPPGSFMALAENIIMLLGDMHLRKMLGENAKKHIQKEYSLEAVSNQSISIYEKVLNGKR